MALNKNVYPYYDDYDASKGFHRVLFHPGKPVQARELTQLQTILQEQVKRHGDHVFKNGTMVIPGHLIYDNKVKYLKLQTIHNNINIDSYLPDLIDKTIVGDTNGIEAIVVHATAKNDTDPTTLFIKYSTGSGTIKEFRSGETLTCPEISGLTFKISPITTYTGIGSICFINDGVFYINGYFVNVAKQIVEISKYSSTASAVVGLDYVESIITENEDESLYDNAFGFSNYGAPGAHRLKIELTLGVKSYDYTAEEATEINFIDLLKIKDGKIEYLKNNTKYAEIEKWLARRTFDESGDYVVKPFSFNAVDYRNNDRGAWAQNTPYLIGDVVSNSGRFYIALNRGYSGATAPVQTYGIQSDGSIYWNEISNKRQFVNDGKYTTTSTDLNVHLEDDKLMYVITSPGKAYIKGFEVDIGSSSFTTAPKARETKQVNNSQVYAPAGSYVVIDTLRGIPNVTTNLTKINLKDLADATVGTAWCRSLEYLTGDTGVADAPQYRLFLFGISMNAGKSFNRDVHAVSSVVFSGNIVPTLKGISGSLAASGTAVTGVGTYFNYELAVGDRVKIGTAWAVVESIESPVGFTATASLGSISAGATGYLGTSVQTKLGNYIAPLAAPAINTMRDSTGAIDTEYVINKYFTFTTSGTSHVITLTGGETFLPTEHTVVLDSGLLSTDEVIDAGYSLNGPATQLTISGLTTSTDYKAMLIVKRVGTFAKEKTKSLAVKTIVLNNAGTQQYTSKNISLTEADCVRLIKVTQSGDDTDKVNYVESGETNVTSFFTFDNGQRPEFYDVGRIRTAKNFNRPLRVTFEYFNHSDGDYFSADSYSSVPRSIWPRQLLDGVEYFLPDYVDFRSRISDAGDEFNNASGGAVSEPLHSEHTMSTSYSYYLPRKDVLVITSDGKINYETSSVIPDGMILSEVNVAAFTADAEADVTFVDKQIQNYTMRKIGSLNDRLENIEYYVALSELEKQTADVSITDEFGLERTKNGFVVDEFKNHEVADKTNPDYKCAINVDEPQCVPLATMECPWLTEPEGTTEASRLSSNYQITGSIASLPYTEETLISQTVASRSINIQPYVVFDFNGVMDINPTEDTWVDNVSRLQLAETIGQPVTITKNVEVVNVISWADQVAAAQAAQAAAEASAQAALDARRLAIRARRLARGD